MIGEGNKTSFRNRLEAWLLSARASNAQSWRQWSRNFFTLPLAMHVDVASEVQEFLAANQGDWALIVIDTLMRNMVGHISDPKDMAAFVQGCDFIREKTGAAVMVLHHEGKDASKGGMGSISRNAAVDGIGKFERKAHQRIFSIVTLRDGSDDMPRLVFELENVPVGLMMDDATDEASTQQSAVLKLVARKTKVNRATDPRDQLLKEICEASKVPGRTCD